jgi:hypothetical protein
VAIEFIGISTINTALKLRAWNIENPGQKGPFKLAATLATCYFVISLAVNVGLDTGGLWVQIIKGLISCFSVISAINLAIRSEQAKRVIAAQNAVALAKKADKDAQGRADADELADQEREDRNARERAERERLWAIQDEERKLKHEEDELARRRAHELKLAKLSASAAKVDQAAVQVAQTPAQVANDLQKNPPTFGKWLHWIQLPDEYKEQVAQIIATEKAIDPKEWKANAKKKIKAAFGIKDRSVYDWIGYAERDYPAMEMVNE